MAPNTDIRPLTIDEPIRKGEIELTEAEASMLEPMNRAERRRWQRANKARKH